MRTAGVTMEAIGSISSTPNAAASSTWRTAARLQRANRAPMRANTVTAVALATIDAASELLTAIITPLTMGIMTVLPFHANHSGI
jgi:hypothetical protein